MTDSDSPLHTGPSPQGVHSAQTLDVFELLDSLDRSGGQRLEGAGFAPVEGDELRGRVFRVKLGFNPNSSSLGTSVVALVWGVGLAGMVFQLVGSWLLNPPKVLPSNASGSNSNEGEPPV